MELPLLLCKRQIDYFWTVYSVYYTFIFLIFYAIQNGISIIIYTVYPYSTTVFRLLVEVFTILLQNRCLGFLLLLLRSVEIESISSYSWLEFFEP